MTPEYAKQLLPLITAYAEGKTIQMRLSVDDWVDIVNPCFDIEISRYRIKPEAKYRPWTMDEVPVGKVVRWKESGGRAAITAVSTGYILVELNWFPAEHYYDYFTMDDGSACGVAVGE